MHDYDVSTLIAPAVSLHNKTGRFAFTWYTKTVISYSSPELLGSLGALLV